MSKVKVKGQPALSGEKEFPVRVSIRVAPAKAGIPVEVCLVFPASWEGRILPQKQVLTTDENGSAEVYLPPTSELVWLVPVPASIKPFFQMSIPGYGVFPVVIPDGVETYTIGE